MKKNVIVGAIGILAMLTAQASQPLLIGKWEIGGAKLISPSSLRPLLERSAQTVGNTDAAQNLDQYVDTAGGERLARAIIALYQERGLLSVEASVDEQAKKIQITEAQGVPSGPYAHYLPKFTDVVEKESLELASMRMSTAASIDGVQVAIEIMPAVNGVSEVRTSTEPTPNAPKAGAVVGYHNAGQRFSGPDQVTASGWANIGNAQRLDISLAHSLSAQTEDSAGGRFEAGTLGYTKAHEFGLTSIQASVTDYKVGGPTFSPLGLSGSMSRVALSHDYLCSKNIISTVRLQQIQNKQDLDLTGWTDTQEFASLFAGLRYQAPGANWGADAGIEQGLGGSQSYSGAQLLGAFDGSFTALTVNYFANFDLSQDWLLALKTGGQTASKNAPSAAQFSLGGPDRGRSYNAGFTATPTGYYASATVHAPAWAGIRAYAGLDAATGTPIIGPDRTAQSAFIGARYASKTFAVDVGFAQHLGSSDDPAARDTKFNVSLSVSF